MTTPILTRVAHAGHGEHRFFGNAVLSGLLGEETLSGLTALAVLGRRLTAEERATIDGVAVCMTAADPRIWPLKACRVAASYGEMPAGFAVGQLAMMGHGMSPRIIGDAAAHLAELRVRLEGAPDEAHADRVIRQHLVEHPRIAGYGIPLRDRDERFGALRSFLADRDAAGRPHWRAQEVLSTWLLAERRLCPNIGIGAAAVLLDLGCSSEQAAALGTLLLEHTLAANAFEGAQQGHPVLQRLPDTCVSYVGRGPRTSPRCAAAPRAQ